MTLALFLALIGLVFVYLEFFLPGGILALIGGLVLVVSVVVFAMQGPGWLLAAVYLLVLLGAVYGIFRLAMYRIKKSAKNDSFYLQNDQEGYVASSFDRSLIGKKGIALSTMKPSGRIQVEGRAYQATSERGYIHKGEPVEVTGGRASYLLVQPLKEK